MIVIPLYLGAFFQKKKFPFFHDFFFFGFPRKTIRKFKSFFFSNFPPCGKKNPQMFFYRIGPFFSFFSGFCPPFPFYFFLKILKEKRFFFFGWPVPAVFFPPLHSSAFAFLFKNDLGNFPKRVWIKIWLESPAFSRDPFLFFLPN